MNLVSWTIIACEIGFWIFIILGLTLRYVLNFKKTGLLFLALTPVLDLILLIIAGVDIYNGATATIAHALAAVYISISIVFGKSMIEWSDSRFRYLVGKGEKPVKLYGKESSKHALKHLLKHLLSFGIGVGVLMLVVYLVDDSSKTSAIWGVIQLWLNVLVIDLIITITYLIWPPQEKKIESS